jgi:hypothetical protein
MALTREPAMKSLIAATLVLFCPLSAWAAADNCVFLNSIDSFNVINDETLIVFNGPKEAYRVNLFGPCRSLRHTETIAVDSRNGLLCWPANNHIVTSRGERCTVDTVLRLAPKEIDAVKHPKP